MNTKSVKVVLCKSITQEKETKQSYKSVLEAAGYDCDTLPVLHFEYINQDKIRHCLQRGFQYSGLILTSQRSVEAISQIKNNESISLNKWHNSPTYCVGPATAKSARELLNLKNILGDGSGNAENLSKLIINNSTMHNLPLLYPCSEIARETIEKILMDKMIKFEKLTVYRTLPSKTLKEEFEQIMNSPVKFIVFFSPSIVEYVMPLIRKNETILKNTKMIAIGQITNEALHKIGVHVSAVSLKPEPIALLNAIKSCEN